MKPAPGYDIEAGMLALSDPAPGGFVLGRRVPVNDTELFCVEVGRGIPMLVMHGGLGVDHTSLREGLDPLGDRLHLVYYDHRGNGRSARPPIETLTHAQLADDADALRAHLGFPRVAVLGHSYGGCLALEYALRHPARVSHLVLVGTAPAFDYPDEIAAELLCRGATPDLVSALLTLPADDAALADGLRRQGPLGFHRVRPETVDRTFRHTVFDAAANVRSKELSASYDVSRRLGEIAAPTLVVTGRHDFYCPPSQAARLHRGIAGSTLVVLDESGHYPFVEQPAAFRASLRAWLDRERGDTPGAWGSPTSMHT